MSKYFIEDTTLADIADAIRLKRDTVDEITPEDMPLAISLIDGGGGGTSDIRRVQFTVELEADSTYLPLTQLTEIPDVLIVSSYDPTVREATSGYGGIGDGNPSKDHITSMVVAMPPIPYFHNNSGTRVNFVAGSAYLRGNNTYFTSNTVPDYGRYSNGDLGWVQPANVGITTLQKAFAYAVRSQRYALDGNGKLVIRNNPTQLNYPFGAGMTYIVTALYDALAPNTLGAIVGLDRTVNNANVIATV